MKKIIVSVCVVIAVLAVIVFLALPGRAQRSVNTSLQFEPSTGLFHLMANAADYPVQRTFSGSGAFTSASPSTLTVTTAPFTSSTSYVCVVSNATNAADTAMKVVNTNGTTFVVTGPNTITDTVNYVCSGT